MLALLCYRRCGGVDWGGEGAEGASTIGSKEPPLVSSAAARVGGGGVRAAHVRY